MASVGRVDEFSVRVVGFGERERVCVCLSVSEFGHVDMGAVKRNSFELGFRLGLGVSGYVVWGKHTHALSLSLFSPTPENPAC